jgi:predicted RNase H-like HicB family nuclease
LTHGKKSNDAHVTLIESPEGWSVSCPALPGCHSQGASREEALENIKEAIRLWQEVAEENAETEVEESGLHFSREVVTV